MINAPWAEGAIGTSQWTGVSLKKVIKHCGGMIDGGRHLELSGAETYFKQVDVSLIGRTLSLTLLFRGRP